MRFYRTVTQLVAQRGSAAFSLASLALSEEEAQAVESPAAFFTHLLRQRALETLGRCEALLAPEEEVRVRGGVNPGGGRAAGGA